MIHCDRVEIRVFTLGGAMVVLGTVVVVTIFGFRAGASFLAGGILSAVNLVALRYLINKALRTGTRSSRIRVIVGYLLRLVLIPLSLYVMMRFLLLGIIAAIAGYFAFICGIFLEGLLEAFRGSSR